MIAGPASKGERAVERNLKWFYPHIRGSLARHLEVSLGQATKEEKRDVQALWLDQPAAQFVGALENSRATVDLCRHSRPRNSCEKQPICVDETTVHDIVLSLANPREHIMNNAAATRFFAAISGRAGRRYSAK
jgi:hypothetical protein